MKQTSILLVEDHTVVRECLRVMLKHEPDMNVIGEAHDGRQAITMALELKPDIILMDIAMPKLNGLEATRQLIKVMPSCRIIILSGNSDDDAVKSAVDAGAAGFLLKILKLSESRTSWNEDPQISPRVKWKFSNSSPRAVATKKPPVNYPLASKPSRNIELNSCASSTSMISLG